MATLFDNRLLVILNPNGSVEPGALLWWYESGGTTPADTYTTPALDVENSNPVEADGEGRFPAIWLPADSAFKYVLTAADSTPEDPIITQDPYNTPATAPSYDPDLADFLAGDEPLPIENGGTASTSATDALVALGAFSTEGGAVTGEITQDTKGAYVFHSASGMGTGELFLLAMADAAPTPAAGQILARY